MRSRRLRHGALDMRSLVHSEQPRESFEAGRLVAHHARRQPFASQRREALRLMPPRAGITDDHPGRFSPRPRRSKALFP